MMIIGKSSLGSSFKSLIEATGHEMLNVKKNENQAMISCKQEVLVVYHWSCQVRQGFYQRGEASGTFR